MVVYGFLNYKDGYVSIPNKELMDKFGEVVQREPSLGNVYKLTKESGSMRSVLKGSSGRIRSAQDAFLQSELLTAKKIRISGTNVRLRCCGRE